MARFVTRVDDTLEAMSTRGPQNFDSRRNRGALHTVYLDDTGDSWMDENTLG